MPLPKNTKNNERIQAISWISFRIRSMRRSFWIGSSLLISIRLLLYEYGFENPTNAHIQFHSHDIEATIWNPNAIRVIVAVIVIWKLNIIWFSLPRLRLLTESIVEHDDEVTHHLWHMRLIKINFEYWEFFNFETIFRVRADDRLCRRSHRVGAKMDLNTYSYNITLEFNINECASSFAFIHT